VALLCDLPAAGRDGRPSKALTLAQAAAVLDAAEGTAMYAYIVLSILIGARTEELRALTWDHVDLDGDPTADPPRPPSIMVWRSVRAGGKTKTRKSRRTLKLPQRCVAALLFHRELQERQRHLAGGAWQDHGLVFASAKGTPPQPQQRAPLLPGHRRQDDAHRRGLDAARDAAQLRIPAVGTPAYPSRRSPRSSATRAAPRSPRPSTSSRSAPCSSVARRRWIAYSPHRMAGPSHPVLATVGRPWTWESKPH
jgi:integrase